MRRSLSMSAPAHEGGYELLAARPASKPGFRRKTWLLRTIGLCVLLGATLATSFTLGRKDNLHKVLLWIHEHTLWGLVIFGLLYVWFTVMFLPPALLAACAGAMYGVLRAIPVVWVCAIIGETVSFLLGRFLLRKWVAELTADWPMWAALNAALREDGWKLVLLLRTSPIMPFSVINYALGSSSLPFSHYFWPSVLGIVPGLIIYVWLGSLAADVTEAVASGGMSAPPAAKITIIVICAVSAVLVVVLSAVYTKRAIDRRLASVNVQEQVQVEEQHYLLGTPRGGGGDESSGRGDGGDAEAAGLGSQRGVLVCVETPVLVARRSSGGAEGVKAAAEISQQQQQQWRLQGAPDHQHRQPGWGLRVAQRLGLSARGGGSSSSGGGSSSMQKLKAGGDEEEALPPQAHCPAGSSGVIDDGSSAVNTSRGACVSRATR